MSPDHRPKRPDTPRAALPWLESQEARRHKRRCQALPPPTDTEVACMVAAFLAEGGAITRLTPAYVAPTAKAI